MKLVLSICVCTFIWLASGPPLQAGVVFGLSSNGQTIMQGGSAVFSLSIHSDALGGDTLDGVEATVFAGLGDGTEGNFTLPSFTLMLGNGPVDLTLPGQAFISNFQLGGIVLSDVNVTLAQLTLSTTGLAVGDYQLSLGNLAANSPLTGALDTTDSGPITFSVIASVPEPSSVVLYLVATCTLLATQRFSGRTRQPLTAKA